jgi:hypothetical protein
MQPGAWHIGVRVPRQCLRSIPASHTHVDKRLGYRATQHRHAAPATSPASVGDTMDTDARRRWLAQLRRPQQTLFCHNSRKTDTRGDTTLPVVGHIPNTGGTTMLYPMLQMLLSEENRSAVLVMTRLQRSYLPCRRLPLFVFVSALHKHVL